MAKLFERRSLFQIAGAAALLRSSIAGAQQPQQQGQQPRPDRPPVTGRGLRLGGLTEPFPGLDRRATVSLTQGEDRRKNVYNALLAIDKQIQPKMKGKKYVVIKPNFVNTQNQLAASHVDGVRGIIDYLSGRFKGPIMIAESSAGETRTAFENFKYTALQSEYKRQQVSLVDLNEEAKYVLVTLLNEDLHIVPCRIAARLCDPEAFVISSGMPKTHNTAIVTLSMKNMALGAPLHQAPKETPRWNEKRKYHVGLRQTHYNMMVTVQRLAPSWGLAVIDGFEGMEGNGPSSGTPVPHRFAAASTDFVATDRTVAELMGVNPDWLGYAVYAGQTGLGQFDPAKIDVIGAKVADLKRQYRMHADIEREMKWMGPMDELPFNLGWTKAIGYEHA